MKIAIIENDQDRLGAIQNSLVKTPWEVIFFKSASEFGLTKLDQFDVIISEVDLPTISGRELFKSIGFKTNAQMFLMSEPTHFIEDDKKNSKIKGLIDKNNPDKLVEYLNYTDVKLRILKMAEKEKGVLEEFFPTNGYSIISENGLIIVRISSPLSNKSMGKLKEEIKESGLKMLVISYSTVKILTSSYLGFLIQLHKFFSKLGGTLIFWNENKDPSIHEQMVLCHLDRVFRIVDSLEEIPESV